MSCVLCYHLQFEWAWQHPTESLAVRKAAATFKSLNGVGNKIKLAYTMVNLPSWQNLNLTVNFFSTKYKKHTAGCPALPRHMKVQVCSMDELSYYSGDNLDMYENDSEIEDDHVVGGSIGEQQNPESNIFLDLTSNEQHNLEPNVDDLTSRNQGTLEANLCQGTNCAEERNLEQHDYSPCSNVIKLAPFRPKLYQPPRECFSPATGLSDDEEKDSNKSSGLSSEVGSATSYSGSFNTAGSLEDSNENKPVHFHPELDQASTKYFSPSRILSDDNEKGPKYLFGISSEVEVIDLYTPSPCPATNTRNKKKRRFSIQSHEIIDLSD
ncbi:hypothetical protein Leryth_014785 [Lithospermum erythrorhizon]|nr:hypothetical protein Leryth_014785 [Lithospermum erythrorhizon]